MKNVILGFWIGAIYCMICFWLLKPEANKEKLNSDWWERFGKEHLLKCDTLHNKCFKIK